MVIVCAWSASSLVSPAGSSASYIHPFVKRFGSFSSVQGVAVDSSTGDVYVYDGERRKLFKFTAAGEPANFSATGTNMIEGLDLNNNANGGIAVDNSSGPAKGDIYVGTIGTPEGDYSGAHTEIGIYSRTGEKLGTLNHEPTVGTPCGVAVDPSGNVYVAMWASHVAKYAPKGNPVTNADFVSSVGEVPYVCQVAVDSLGDVYPVEWTRGPVRRYDSSQFGSLPSTASVLDQKGSSVAVDPLNDEVYVNERNRVAQFGAYGEPFEQPVAIFAAEGAGGIGEGVGIAISGYNHNVYVSGGGEIVVFGPLGLVATVTTDATAVPRPQGVTFSGTVDPEGLAIGECKVEYGASTAYGQSQPCVESPAQIGSGSSPVEVHADVTGVVPGTYYHYRVVAVNANGRGEGADQSVALAGPPAVSGESFSNLEEAEVSLRAQIDPDFRSTTYHVDYGTSEAYGQSTPESQPVGSDNDLHPVLIHLAGLAPGTTYHFRFVATNSYGTTYGKDVRFTTYPAPPSSPPAEGGSPSQSVPAGGECAGVQCETGLSAAPPAFNPVHWEVPQARPAALTRAQKLARALKACRHKHGKARHRCEAAARKRYRARKSGGVGRLR